MFDFEATKKLLDDEVKKRDTKNELSLQKADPLLVASKYKDEYVSLICAMYAYGNANMIVKFLSSLDFSLLNANKQEIVKNLNDKYYRFQSKRDTQELFITLNKIKKTTTLQKIFLEGYHKNYDVMDGIFSLIETIYDANSYRSRGYEFLIGKVPKKNPTSPYKRWHMYLRWMVRDDNLDLGLWSGVRRDDLLMPLDTHTFKIGQKLGLIERKTYDFKAVVELTSSLIRLDNKDPIKYDFALYRIGQEKLL
ncbi:MAG: TIGR02757 family protein [Epsilonproteobacteria bacterium]|nr:TIGR02757 family protein [Campylobacterota bacterium]